MRRSNRGWQFGHVMLSLTSCLGYRAGISGNWHSVPAGWRIPRVRSRRATFRRCGAIYRRGS
jgi:hypothetical protein